MKKILFLAIVATFSLLALSSCYGNVSIPYGKWVNTELDLVLDIHPQESCKRQFPGTYREIDEKINIYVVFDTNKGEFWIFRESDKLEGGFRFDDVLYGGDYKLRSRQLYLSLGRGLRERTGIDAIILDLIVDYD